MNDMVVKGRNRRNFLVPLLLVITGGLMVAVPRQFFPVCGYSDPMNHGMGMMRCQSTGTMTVSLGFMTLLASLLLMFVTTSSTKKMILSAVALFGGSLFVLYLAWPGVCRTATMPCRVGTLPAALLVGGLQFVIAGLALTRELRRRHG